MQAKTLLPGVLAGVSLTVLSLTLGSSVAVAQSPVAQAPMQGYEPTQIILNRDELFVVRKGVLYKVNKLVMSRAGLR